MTENSDVNPIYSNDFPHLYERQGIKNVSYETAVNFVKVHSDLLIQAGFTITSTQVFSSNEFGYDPNFKFYEATISGKKLYAGD